MKRTAILMCVLLGTVGFTQAQDHMGDEVAAAVAEGALVEGKSKFRDTWVNPAVDFTRYNKILAGDAVFEFRDVGPGEKYRSTMHSRNSRNEFGILEQDQEKFKDVVSEAFLKELTKSKKYDIVEEAGPGTILLEGSVLDIVSNVPPELTGRSDVYLSTVGSATLVIELLDSETGQILAYVEERRKITPPGSGQIDRFSMPTSSVSVWSDVGRWARSSASRLRSSMEKAQKGR
jgi:Protein of unknown function (DUF3313)